MFLNALYLIVGTLAALGCAVIVPCSIIATVTRGRRPRWYVALMQRISRALD